MVFVAPDNGLNRHNIPEFAKIDTNYTNTKLYKYLMQHP